MSRTTMPRARPSTTISSSISWRENISTWPSPDLALEGLVGAEEQLLARLPAGVERPGDLGAAEGAVVEEPAVLAGERDAQGDALVDDRDRDLGQPVDVGLAGPEVPALDRVVEEPLDAVAVVAVVLRGVDPALRRDRVRAARGILVAEALDVVAELGHRRRAARAGEARSDHDHGVLPLVRRVDELHLEAVLVPLLLDRAGGDVRIELHAPTSGSRRAPPAGRRCCRGR